MKTLKPHPHVIKLLGCVTEYGKLFAKTPAPIFNPCLSTLYKINAVCSCYKYILIELTDGFYYTLDILLSWSSVRYEPSKFQFHVDPLLVLIEYVPYGDLLGYLRKSRGLNDNYYKDPDIKPQTSLTSQQLMKFAREIADGMSYLSSRSVSWSIFLLSLVLTVTFCKVINRRKRCQHLFFQLCEYTWIT